MEKQTAVEWLIEKLLEKNLIEKNGDTLKLIGQAKELEKQQIIDFANDWMYNSDTSAKEYYQEKFKQ